MADKRVAEITCPKCAGHDVLLVNQKSNLRPRPQTGNLHTDLTPISTTATYKCQKQGCGHDWSATIPR